MHTCRRSLRTTCGRPIWLHGSIGRFAMAQGERCTMTSKFAALCAAAICAGFALSAAPASAQNRLQTCNAEWNAMKANNTVGDKKYADFRKECLARTARPAQHHGRRTRRGSTCGRRAGPCRQTGGTPTAYRGTGARSRSRAGCPARRRRRAGIPGRRIVEILHRERRPGADAHLPRSIQREQSRQWQR